MDTSGIQEMLIAGLAAFGVPEEAALGILLMLEEDNQRMELMAQMSNNPHWTAGRILEAAVEITGGPMEMEIAEE